MNASGRFGEFGGCYAPETLVAPLQRLEAAWQVARTDRAFGEELDGLLRTFAGRPTPLHFAANLSRELGLELWLKREDLLHTGAHKINNAIGQCLLARRMGKRRIVAETGAGQHGVATAAACAQLGLECVVYMGDVDAERQKPNVTRMELLGARVERVHTGQKTLKDAVNAAMRDWTADPEGTHYCLGSALGPHPFPSIVAGFHEVIGREARAQFRGTVVAGADRLPDVVVACVGGGSNAIGIFRAFVEHPGVELVGVEAGGRGIASGEHAARFAGGSPGVLHGTRTYVLQDAEGQIRPTHSVSAGLDYPAVGPEHAALHDSGRARYESASDEQALSAFERLARAEGILPALESAHALAWVVRAAPELRGMRVLLNLSGRGDKDIDTVARLRAERSA
jgi:tryptophan synthase beta chain